MPITIERILTLKKQNHISEQEICRILDAKKDKLYTWKMERSTPTTEEVSILADYFGVSIDYLLGRTDDPTPHQNTKAADTEVGGKLNEIFRRVDLLPEDKQALALRMIESLIDTLSE
jgi:transcriptional regulator with XRE-family HTH domain